MDLSVYLAGKFEDQPILRVIADRLESTHDINVTSRWLNERLNVPHGKGMPLRDRANRDLDDIEAADVVVVFPNAFGPDNHTVGRHVETGYALAKGIPIVFVGTPRHTFYTLGAARHLSPPKSLRHNDIQAFVNRLVKTLKRLT